MSNDRLEMEARGREIERLEARVAELEAAVAKHRSEVMEATDLAPWQWVKSTERSDADLWSLLDSEER